MSLSSQIHIDKNQCSQVPFVVLGANGMLGRAWCGLFSADGTPFGAYDVGALDLTLPKDLDRLAAIQPKWLINCAAYTNVDGAESDKRAAFVVNAEVPASLAEICARTDSMLLHYSTDYVFGGETDRPRRVHDARDPLSVYGQSKLEGERAILRSGCRALIIRTSWLYAPWGRNFVRTIAAAAWQKDELCVVEDQRGRPTNAMHLAKASRQLLRLGTKGIYHVTDGGECTRFEFAREIVRLIKADCTVKPCTSEEYRRPARRPTYSVLDLAETERLIGPMPAWQDNLAKILQRIEAERDRSPLRPKPSKANTGFGNPTVSDVIDEKARP